MFGYKKLYLRKNYWEYVLSWKRFVDIFLLCLALFVFNDWGCLGDSYDSFKIIATSALVFILGVIFGIPIGVNPFNFYPLLGLIIIFSYDIFASQIWVPVLVLLLSRINLLAITSTENYNKTIRKEQGLYILFSLVFLLLKVCGITIITKEILGFLFLISFLLPWSAYYPFVYCMEPGLYYDFHYEEALIREFLAPIVYWMIYLGFLDSIWYYVGLLI